jgi:uncharacterized protein (DUF1697 family)
MAIFVALLRAVNVGGTGALPMAQLRNLCADLGWQAVRTYIQSGNVVFESASSEPILRDELQRALAAHAGRPIGVAIRKAADLKAILMANPFPDAKPAQVGVVFLSEPVPADMLAEASIPGPEEMRAIGREIFIHYPDGMGRSKLKLPLAARNGTVRNVNTVAKLVAMTDEGFR